MGWKWTVSESQLDYHQKAFLNDFENKEKIWLSGLPGTGKSVVIAFAIRKLLKKNPNTRIGIVVYTHALIDLFKTGMHEFGLDANFPIMTTYQFLSSGSKNHYDYLFCDEVQDLPIQDIETMKECCSHLILAGDENQSIYPNDVKRRLPTVTPQVLKPYVDSFESLNIIYRLSLNIQEAIKKILPSLNFTTVTNDPNRENTEIRLRPSEDKYNEAEFILESAKEYVKNNYSSAILFSTRNDILYFCKCVAENNGINPWETKYNKYGKADFSAMNKYYQSRGLPLEYVGNGHGSLENANNNQRIILMTYYSAKGLDFENVYLPSLNQEMYISNRQDLERRILMVAMTRSKNNLFISYTSELNYLINSFKSLCYDITQDEKDNTPNNDDDAFSIF